MKKARKALLTLCAALLLVSMTVGVTLAYLTDDTAAVVNTFTVGNVTIDLDEAPVNEYGEVVDGERGQGNNYKLIPGHVYTKDPVAYVLGGSENCYLFIKVVNGIEAIEAEECEGIEDYKTIAEQMADHHWLPLAGEEGVYYFEYMVGANEEDQPFPVFDYFVIDGEAAVEDYTDAQVTIDAYAVQADGFADAAAAWAAAEANWDNN